MTPSEKSLPDNNQDNNQDNTPDLNSQILERKNKLKDIRENEKVAYPNDFEINTWAEDLHQTYGEHESDYLKETFKDNTINVAGRMMLRRIMGKAAFFHIQDMTGRIQVYIRKNELTEKNLVNELSKILSDNKISDILNEYSKIYSMLSIEGTSKKIAESIIS